MALLVVAVVLVSAALAIAVYLAATSRSEPTGVARSLAIVERRIDRHEVGRNELPAKDRFVVPLLEQTMGIGTWLSPKGAAARLTRLLDQAGNPIGWSAEKVLGAKGAGLIVGIIAGLLVGGLSVRGLFWMAGLGALCFILPDLLLYNTGLRRQDELRRGLADALDMLTVCVEAGQGFNAAILQVAKSVGGPISGEFARVLSEIQIGRSRADAFSALAERANVAELRTFVSALVQADRLGLPIASVLRGQAKEMRVARRQRAEEKAQKVPVKIIFPVMICIFPTVFVVILGPAAIRMISVFSGGQL
ncbi:MAG: type II secretion system F family protein [Candidatus Phosphoribacter sp.]